MNLLEAGEWTKWLTQIGECILEVDRRVSEAQSNKEHVIVPLPMSAEALQEPNLREQRRIGRRLMSIANAALGLQAV